MITKSVLFSVSLVSLLVISLLDSAIASGRGGKISSGDKEKEDILAPQTSKKKTSVCKRKEEAKESEKYSSVLDQSPILSRAISNVNSPQIKELEDFVEFSPSSWAQLQPCLDDLIKKTLADPSYEKRTFHFDVRREDWDSHWIWQKALMEESKYPISFSFFNNGAEGDRIDGIYAIYHTEVSITNYSKKEEARKSYVYRFFKGELDKSLINENTFYNLMVRAGLTEEDFETGKYGYQDRIFVKPIKLIGETLSNCIREVQDTIDETLKKADQPFVAFVFELPVNANFKVQDLTPNHLYEQPIPTIIEENEKRLYLCFFNDKRKTLDLHGKSYKEAFKSVINFIKERHSNYEDSCTIITGRGNHANSNGTHGVIFSDFLKWMKDKKVRSLVQHCIPRDGVYTVFLKKPVQCDLTGLNPEQNPYKIVRDALRKIIQTKDLRLRIKVNSEDFEPRLIHFLSLNEPELCQEISPLSMDSSSGELRLNLKKGEGTGIIISFSDSEAEEVITPSAISSKAKSESQKKVKKGIPINSSVKQSEKVSPSKNNQNQDKKSSPQKATGNINEKTTPAKGTSKKDRKPVVPKVTPKQAVSKKALLKATFEDN